MTDRNLTNVWCWSPNPPPSVTNAWQAECWANGSHIVAHAATQQAVQDKLYLDHPELRGIVRWVFEAPPKPKRPDDPKPANTAIEGESVASAFHRAIVREFHPDHHPDRTYTGHDTLAAVNRLWDEATAKT
jgi:hypothetical protein